jgi:hypothetical protein
LFRIAGGVKCTALADTLPLLLDRSHPDHARLHLSLCSPAGEIAAMDTPRSLYSLVFRGQVRPLLPVNRPDHDQLLLGCSEAVTRLLINVWLILQGEHRSGFVVGMACRPAAIQCDELNSSSENIRADRDEW